MTSKRVLPPHIKIATQWFSTWLPRLSAESFKSYFELANTFELYKPAGIQELEAMFREEAVERLDKQYKKLEEYGLVEIIEKSERRYFHLPHRDLSGMHHAQAVLPSVKDALGFQKRMNEEIFQVSSLDDTEELRNHYFDRYPELREEYVVYEETKDEDSPRWRLWLELSRFLIHKFEERFGTLKSAYREIFKESASQILQHKLSIIDAVTKEVFEQKDRIFPEVGDDWLVSSSDEAFILHPIVQALSRRFDVGPAQIFVNTLERLAQNDYIVVETNSEGSLIDLLLPTTTSLTKSEERILFLRPDEREGGQDSERNRERARRATNKYANFLMDRGVEVLLRFVKRDKVQAFDRVLDNIAARVNENLDLIPNRFDEEPITIDHVLEKYNAFRERALTNGEEST